ncbi:glycosyltransferase, partial [bacterium]|nr:glycosyltransferase [bacterium]
IVVASEFMRGMVERGPLTSGFERVHTIPFGIKRSWLAMDDARAASRAALRIPDDHFVIFLRGSRDELKGVRFLIDALRMRPFVRRATLLTVDARGVLGELAAAYNVIDMGWVEDQSLYPRLLAASDVFVMPSIAEGFGLMALEAMAAGRPVVCFEGTAVATLTHSPECGVAVPMGDARALRAAIDGLAEDSEDARRRGEMGRALAETVYEYDRYLDAMTSLYESVCLRTR